MEIEYDNQIVRFIHCKKCLDERPPTVSPREYVQLEVGFTAPGLQVWCKRHEVNVMNIDFEGAGPFPANIGIERIA
jgi:hypothetical protein